MRQLITRNPSALGEAALTFRTRLAKAPLPNRKARKLLAGLLVISIASIAHSFVKDSGSPRRLTPGMPPAWQYDPNDPASFLPKALEMDQIEREKFNERVRRGADYVKKYLDERR
jgi:hypothetical protein